MAGESGSFEMRVKSSNVKVFELPCDRMLCTCETIFEWPDEDNGDAFDKSIANLLVWNQGEYRLSISRATKGSDPDFLLAPIKTHADCKHKDARLVVLLLTSDNRCLIHVRGQLGCRRQLMGWSQRIKELSKDDKTDLYLWVSVRFPHDNFEKGTLLSDSQLKCASEEVNSLASQLRMQSDFSFSDIAIKVGEKMLPCHKFILGLRSDVLKAMFKSDLFSEKNFIDWGQIGDFPEKTAVEFLRFVYTDEINDLEEVDLHLLQIADYYQIPRLSLLCAQSLCKNIQSRNLADVFKISAKLASHNDYCAIVCQSAKEWILLRRPLLLKVSDEELDVDELNDEMLKALRQRISAEGDAQVKKEKSSIWGE